MRRPFARRRAVRVAGLALTLALGAALGLGLATALGGFFAWRWQKTRNLHEIALGHALYDAAVMLLVLYGPSAGL